MESPARAQAGESPLQEGLGSNCDQAFSTILDLGGQFLAPDSDCVVALDIRAAANLVRNKWLGHRKKTLGRWGVPRPVAYPACARLTFNGGRLGDVRFAADIPTRIAGSRGEFAASAPEPGIPSRSNI